MNTEPIMSEDTVPTEPTRRWADDGGVLTERPEPEPESVNPDSSVDSTAPETPTETEALEGDGSSAGTSTETTSAPVVRDPFPADEPE